MFAFVFGAGQRHLSGDRRTGGGATAKCERQFVARVVAERLDLRSEVVGERPVHQIEQRQAEQVVGVFEAEQLEIVVVRVDVHAFVHVRDRSARVRQQQFAAPFGFLQRAARLREAVTLADVLEFALHDIKEAFVVVVEYHVGCAHREATRQVLRLGRIVHDDDRQIRLALAQRRQHLFEVIETGTAEQQIYGLFGDRFV